MWIVNSFKVSSCKYSLNEQISAQYYIKGNLNKKTFSWDNKHLDIRSTTKQKLEFYYFQMVHKYSVIQSIEKTK